MRRKLGLPNFLQPHDAALNSGFPKRAAWDRRRETETHCSYFFWVYFVCVCFRNRLIQHPNKQKIH